MKNIFSFVVRRAAQIVRLVFNEVRKNPVCCLLVIPFISYKEFIYSNVLIKSWAFLLLSVLALLMFSFQKLNNYTGKIEIKYIALLILI